MKESNPPDQIILVQYPRTLLELQSKGSRGRSRKRSRLHTSALDCLSQCVFRLKSSVRLPMQVQVISGAFWGRIRPTFLGSSFHVRVGPFTYTSRTSWLSSCEEPHYCFLTTEAKLAFPSNVLVDQVVFAHRAGKKGAFEMLIL